MTRSLYVSPAGLGGWQITTEGGRYTGFVNGTADEAVNRARLLAESDENIVVTWQDVATPELGGHSR